MCLFTEKLNVILDQSSSPHEIKNKMELLRGSLAHSLSASLPKTRVILFFSSAFDQVYET